MYHLNWYGNATKHVVPSRLNIVHGGYSGTGGLKGIRKRTNWQKKGSRLLSEVQRQSAGLAGQRAKDLCRKLGHNKTSTQMETLSLSTPWENSYSETRQLISGFPSQIKQG